MKRSQYFWFWKVSGGCLDIIFFGMLGYWAWNYTYREPDTTWIFLANAWVFLCASLIVPPFKFYHFVKSLYSKDVSD